MNEYNKRTTAYRLAAVYPLESLKQMQISAGIALDRAVGRAIYPARQRYWTLDEAIEIAAMKREQK